MLKKLLLKAVMFGFVMFGLSTYAGYLMTGRLPPFIDKFREFLPTSASRIAGQPSWNNLDALSHKATAQPKNYEVMQSGKTVIYKWKNPNGTWSYSGTAPPAGMNATRQEIVMAAQPPAETAAHEDAPAAASGELVNPYSPEGVKELIDRAKQVRQQVEAHSKEQQTQLNHM